MCSHPRHLAHSVGVARLKCRYCRRLCTLRLLSLERAIRDMTLQPLARGLPLNLGLTCLTLKLVLKTVARTLPLKLGLAILSM